jgi:hypothetical protein
VLRPASSELLASQGLLPCNFDAGQCAWRNCLCKFYVPCSFASIGRLRKWYDRARCCISRARLLWRRGCTLRKGG